MKHITDMAAPTGGRQIRPNAHLQRVIDPLRLRLLLEVDRRGSITRAAEALSMAQPTASTHLRTLEKAVGRQLYERAGRATRLTDAGRVLARHAAVVLSTLEGLEEDLAALDGALIGTLLLASCDAFGVYVLPAVLAEFAAERPQADIQIRIVPCGEVVDAVARGDAHLGIAGPTRRPAGVKAERLLRDELVWVAPAGDAVPGIVSPALLQELTVIVPAPESSTRAVAERILSRVGSRPARLLRLDSIEAVKRTVTAAVGIAAVSRLAVADELASGALRAVELIGGGSPELVIDIVRQNHRKPTPLEQAFEHAVRLHCVGLSAMHALPRSARSRIG